jgi:hypothetical protein
MISLKDRKQYPLLKELPNSLSFRFGINAIYLVNKRFIGNQYSNYNKKIDHHGIYINGFYNYELNLEDKGEAETLLNLTKYLDELKVRCLFISYHVKVPISSLFKLRELGFLLISDQELAVKHTSPQNIQNCAHYNGILSYYYKSDPWIRSFQSVPLSFNISLNYLGEIKNEYNLHDEREIDVAFVGQLTAHYSEGRQFFLTNLSERLRKHKIKLSCYGNGFKNLPHLRGILIRGVVHPKTYQAIPPEAIYMRSKIGFNYDLYHKDRTFKILLSGALLISRNTEQMRDYKDLIPGKDYIAVNNQSELTESIIYYTKKNKEREFIAKSGHEKAKRLYSLNRIFSQMPKQFKKEVLKKEYNGTLNWNFESIAVILLTNSNFKAEAIDYLLNNYKKAKSFRNILIKVSSEIPDLFQGNIFGLSYYYSKFFFQNDILNISEAFLNISLESFDYKADIEFIDFAITLYKAMGNNDKAEFYQSTRNYFSKYQDLN